MVYASFCGRLTRQTRVGGSGVERPPCLCALSIGSRSKISTGSATFPPSIHPSNPLDVLKMQPDRNSIRSKTVAHITAIWKDGNLESGQICRKRSGKARHRGKSCRSCSNVAPAWVTSAKVDCAGAGGPLVMNPAPLCPPPTHLQALLIAMSGEEENWSNRVEKKERTQ